MDDHINKTSIRNIMTFISIAKLTQRRECPNKNTFLKKKEMIKGKQEKFLSILLVDKFDFDDSHNKIWRTWSIFINCAEAIFLAGVLLMYLCF